MGNFGLLTAAAVFLSAPAVAQVTVGTANDIKCTPFACNATGTTSGQSVDYYQMFSSSAFSSPITFNTLSFRDGGVGGPGDLIGGTYDITFYTTTGGLSSDFSSATHSNLATFLDQTLAASGSTAGLTLTGTPYTYNPATGNLVMEVLVTNQQGVSPASASWLAADNTGTFMNRIVFWPGMAELHDSAGIVTTFSLSAVPEPATWAMMLLGFGAIGFAMRWRNVTGVLKRV